MAPQKLTTRTLSHLLNYNTFIFSSKTPTPSKAQPRKRPIDSLDKGLRIKNYIIKYPGRILSVGTSNVLFTQIVNANW